MTCLLRQASRSIWLLAFLLLTVAPARSETAVAKAEGSVVRVLDLLVFSDPAAIERELPFFRRVHSSTQSTKPSLWALGSGFFVDNSGLLLTTADMAKFDELELKSTLSSRAQRTLNRLLEEATAESQKTALQAEYDLSMARIDAASKALFASKAIIQEIYAARRVKETVEFRKAEVVENRIDFGRNVAMLRVPGINSTALKLNVSEAGPGVPVHALGFPDVKDLGALNAVEAWVTAGKKEIETSPTADLFRFAQVSRASGAVRRTVPRGWRLESIQLPIVEFGGTLFLGDSGGPLVNEAGQVVGMNVVSPGDSTGQGVGNALAASELHRLMDNEWHVKHLTTQGSPWSSQGMLLVAIGGVALIGIAALLIAFRKSSGPGQHTVVNWVANAQPPMGAGYLADEPPPLPLDEPPPLDDFGGASQNRSTLQGRRDSRLVTGNLESTVTQSKRAYESFQLRPEESGGPIIDLDARRFARENGRLIMGRSADLAHVQVDDRNVSKRHAAVRVRGENLYIEDLESANGTLVNGKKLEPFRDMLIEPGDTITFGKLSFRLRLART